MNDLQAYLHTNHVNGIVWNVNNEHITTYIKLLILLFADDTVSFGICKEDLQVALNVFEQYCDIWKLTVNISKTKIMIFSGGRLPANLHFYFKGIKVEIVSEYKYLGIFLARSGSFLKKKTTKKKNT